MPRNRSKTQDGARDPQLVEVGRRIKRARLALSLEQKDLAELVHVTEKTVSNWEVGVFSPHRKIPELAAALGIAEGYLWQGEQDVDKDLVARLLEQQIRLLRSILDELRLLRFDRIERRSDDETPM